MGTLGSTYSSAFRAAQVVVESTLDPVCSVIYHTTGW